MFFINESNNHLTVNIVDDNNKPVKVGGERQVISKIKQLVVIGKNTIHDNLITTYVNKSSLSFLGFEIAQFKPNTPVDIYSLANDEGFVFYDHTAESVFISRSFYQLVNYCLGLGFSIFGILNQSAVSHQIASKHIINNDFNPKKIQGTELPLDDLLSFDLYWNSNDDQMSFEMLIQNADFVVNENNPLFTEYTGFATNIGRFRKTILSPMQDGDRVPDLFPELELEHCVTFTELVDDNALSVLVPNILTHSQYQNLISEMRSIDRKQLSYSGVSKLGYSIQANIELLDESETMPHFEAKVTRLIISPEDFLVKSFLKV